MDISIGAVNGGIEGSGYFVDSFINFDLVGGTPGDFDGNGAVDINDLLQLLGAWGPCDDCPEDINGDGQVGIADLLELLGNWG